MVGDYIGAMHERQIADLRRDREELDARIAQLEYATDMLFGALTIPGGDFNGALTQLHVARYGNATPTPREAAGEGRPVPPIIVRGGNATPTDR